MSSQEDKEKHSKRIRKKKSAKVRSVIAKELKVNKRYRQRVIKSKDGKEINSFCDLVEAIQENDSED